MSHAPILMIEFGAQGSSNLQPLVCRTNDGLKVFRRGCASDQELDPNVWDSSDPESEVFIMRNEYVAR